MDSTGFPGFSGDGCMCTNSGYQATFVSSTWPEYEASGTYDIVFNEVRTIVMHIHYTVMLSLTLSILMSLT